MKVSTINCQNSYIPNLKIGWLDRTYALVKFIESNDLDIAALQEVTERVKKILVLELKDYFIVGNNRHSILFTNESNCILIKKIKYKILFSYTYSLSNDMYKLGNKFKFDIFPRICTVALINTGKIEYLILNTHLDNILNYNRKLELDVIEKIITKYNQKNIILLGDFNMGNSTILENFLNRVSLKDLTKNLKDSSYRKYKYKNPIDHIIISNQLVSFNIYIDKNKYNNLFLSDHYPVIAKIKQLKN